MPAEVVEHWLQTGRSGMICQIALRPIENALFKGIPLSSQKGQAEAFFLIDDKGNWWILKKFHSNCNLDRTYLARIGSVLPRDEGFACGTERSVLSQGSLQKARGCHYCRQLDSWLDGTVLMPRIAGLDWATLADELREDKVRLDESQRLTLCGLLARLVELLEKNRCAHRDLSCGNVFIDLGTWTVYLIDFDSLYHPSLAMPQMTTCGTRGYTSHLAWNNGNLDARRTWCECADRYALALISTEFLLVHSGMKATDEGGIFDQDELRRQSGGGIDSILAELRARYPQAAALLQATIRSQSFLDCPSPHDWSRLAGGHSLARPTLDEMPVVSWTDFNTILKRLRPAAPLWPAPSLQDMPVVQIPELRTVKGVPMKPPPDPWKRHGSRITDT